MVDLIDELREIEKSCAEAATRMTGDAAVANWLGALRQSAAAAGAAFSGSWIGYHAKTYIRDLRARRPNEFFDAEWGAEESLSGATRGDWVIYDGDELGALLVARSGVNESQMRKIEETAKEVGAVFDHAKGELMPILDALLAEGHQSPVREARDKLASTSSHVGVDKMISAARPRQLMSRDRAAISEGWVVPAHALLAFRVADFISYGDSVSVIAGQAASVSKYLVRRSAISNNPPKQKRQAKASGATSVATKWLPRSFEQALKEIGEPSLKAMLKAHGAQTCPSPSWDTERRYRVSLVNDSPVMQRFAGKKWESAPIEPVQRGDAMAKVERRTDTRLFISHSSEDYDLAEQLTMLIDGVLTVPKHWMRCTSIDGFKLEPGADGPEELRKNLYDANVVIGVLTPSSLASAYVLMELGAAWGFESWVVPLLAAGVDFKQIPGPIGSGVHAVTASREQGVESVLEVISNRCNMVPRVTADRRHTLVKKFVTFASSYTGNRASPTIASKETAPVVQPPVPAPLDMHEGDRVGRLRIWLHDLQERGDPRSKGRPFSIAEIDAEAKVPPGTALQYLESALDRNWRVSGRNGGYVELVYSPSITVVG